MSENQIEQINQSLNIACYGNLNEYSSSFNNIDDVDELLVLIEPHHFIDIVNKSIALQIELIINLRNSISKNKITGIDKIKFKKEFEGLLLSNFNNIGNEIEMYKENLDAYRHNIEIWKENAAETFSSNTILGGALGFALGGFLGAAIGGALFANSDSSSENESQRELKIVISQFQSIAENVELALDKCFNDCKDIIIEYISENKELAKYLE
jgi:hypothetical protein